jgi:hypothetical protein
LRGGFLVLGVGFGKTDCQCYQCQRTRIPNNIRRISRVTGSSVKAVQIRTKFGDVLIHLCREITDWRHWNDFGGVFAKDFCDNAGYRLFRRFFRRLFRRCFVIESGNKRLHERYWLIEIRLSCGG